MGIQLGNFFIPYYGLLIVLGLAAACAVGRVQVNLFKGSYDDFITVGCCVGLGAILGAKILYFIVSWQQIDFSRLMDLDYLQAVMAGGFVFYGGLIGGLLGLIACRKLFNIDVSFYTMFSIPCIPIVHAFGRLGCSAVGCCYGIPYDGVGAIIYRHSAFAPNHLSLFPVQAAEAIMELLIAAILLVYINRRRTMPKRSLELYLFMYAILRFGLEFLRYDAAERGIYFFFSTSQWISLGIVLCVFLLWLKPKIHLPHRA